MIFEVDSFLFSYDYVYAKQPFQSIALRNRFLQLFRLIICNRTSVVYTFNLCVSLVYKSIKIYHPKKYVTCCFLYKLDLTDDAYPSYVIKKSILQIFYVPVSSLMMWYFRLRLMALTVRCFIRTIISLLTKRIKFFHPCQSLAVS